MYTESICVEQLETKEMVGPHYKYQDNELDCKIKNRKPMKEKTRTAQ